VGVPNTTRAVVTVVPRRQLERQEELIMGPAQPSVELPAPVQALLFRHGGLYRAQLLCDKEEEAEKSSKLSTIRGAGTSLGAAMRRRVWGEGTRTRTRTLIVAEEVENGGDPGDQHGQRTVRKPHRQGQ